METKTKTKKAFTAISFDFVGTLGGDLLKRKRFDLVSCKISLLVHTETRSPRSGVWAVRF